MARLRSLRNGWLWGGVALGLVASFLALLAALCPPAAEIVFALTILGAVLAGVIGGAVRRSLARTGAFMIGMSLGFVTAFILIFVVFAQYFPDGC